MRQIFIAALVLFSTINVFGQYSLKGKVVDEKGNPLVGAIVVIQNSTNGKSTDKFGQFSFNKVTKKIAKLVVSFVGYEQETVKATADIEILVKLQPKSVSIDEITVRSLRANDKSPVAYSNIDKETLSKTNLGQDIPYLLSQTPSLVVSSDAGTGIGYTGFRIRGTDAARINVTINGIPYNDPDEQGAYWVDLPDFASSVQSVQVQRGVGTSTNGAGAFGANINLQTDNYSPKASAESNVTVGSFNTLKATLKASTGLINGHWAIDTRISSVQSDGYVERASVNLKSYFVQAGYFDENTTVKFVTFGGTEKTYHAWWGNESSTLTPFVPTYNNTRTYNLAGLMGYDAVGNPLYYQNQTDNYTQTNYQLLGIHTFSSELSMNIGLHYTRGDGYYEEYNKNEPWSPVNLKAYSLTPFVLNGETVTQSDLVTQKKMGNDFAGGVFSFNYQKDKLSAQLGGAINNYWGNQWGDVIWVKNYIGDVLPITEYYRNNVNKSDANIYLKANYEILPKLNFYGDLQYRNVTYRIQGVNKIWDDSKQAMEVLDVDTKFNFLNPKAGLFYHPNSNNDYFISFAIANREPARSNYTNGTKSTWPTNETLYDTELGYKFYNDFISVGANAYLMMYRNQLILTGKINDVGEAVTMNIPSSYRAGIELVGSIKPFSWLRWDCTATISKNRILDFEETVNVVDSNWIPIGKSVNTLYHNTPIAFSPDLLANSMITFTKGNFEAGFQSIYVGKQFVDNTGKNDREMSDYFINNLRLSYSLPVKGLRGLEFILLVNNFFNEMYISNAASYPSISQNISNPVYDKNTIVNNDFYCFPQTGRNVLASVNVKF